MSFQYFQKGSIPHMSFIAVITPVQGDPSDPGTVTPPINLPPGVWPNPPGGGLPPGAGTKPPGVGIWPPQLPPLPPGVVRPPIALPPNLPAFPIMIPDTPENPIVIPPTTWPPGIWPPLDPSTGLPPTGRTLVLIWIAGAGWRWLLVDLSQPKK